MSGSGTTPTPRIALYSHDAQGLGHIRRNLAIATALVDSSATSPEILLITGAPGASTMPVPPGADFLVLPALTKRLDGSYGARSMAGPLDALLRLRSRVLQAALGTFNPDVLIVDKVARGIGGELEPALTALRRRGRTRCVLGLRDVLDDGPAARAEWRAERVTEAIAHLYDAVWVYGDPRVYDLVAECQLPPIVADRTTFTGYLGHGRPPGSPPPLGGRLARPSVLCLVGGGQDGLELARCFARTRLPEGRSGVIVAGPYMPPGDRLELEHLVAGQPDMALAGSVDGTEHLIAAAESVVSMGGYNSVCEVLADGKPVLVVPRVRPRAEQLVRAERLAELGLVDVVHPDQLSPDRIERWLATPPGDRPLPESIDLDGLRRLPVLVDALLAPTSIPVTPHPSFRQVVDVAV